MQWRHQQELTEVKQNIEVMMKEMKANLTKESQRTIEEFKKQAELERLKAVAEAPFARIRTFDGNDSDNSVGGQRPGPPRTGPA